MHCQSRVDVMDILRIHVDLVLLRKLKAALSTERNVAVQGTAMSFRTQIDIRVIDAKADILPDHHFDGTTERKAIVALFS